MIVSVHVPKTGGRTFEQRIQATFGARALIDYGDWTGVGTPEAAARDESRRVAMRARREELQRDYAIIHGHFVADKYVGLFPTLLLVAFLRDPYQQTVSHYQFFLRNPDLDHPAVKAFHERRMSLPAFAAAFPNLQSQFLGQVALDDFAVVGLTEDYARGIALFERVSGRALMLETSRENVNPHRHGDAYEIDDDVRKAVDRHRAADLEVYRLARERYQRLCARYAL